MIELNPTASTAIVGCRECPNCVDKISVGFNEPEACTCMGHCKSKGFPYAAVHTPTFGDTECKCDFNLGFSDKNANCNLCNVDSLTE